MGLASSQARALLLVARKSDIEYRMQCLTQRKMVLAMQTEQIARDYSTRLNKKTLKFVYNLNGSTGETKTEDLSYYSLMLNANYIGQYRVTDAMGRVVVPSYAYIPQATIEKPVYTKVNDNNEVETKANTIYTASSKKLGESSAEDKDKNKIYPEIYLPSIGEDGNQTYVLIQDNKGNLQTDAKLVDTNRLVYNVFSKAEDGSYVMNSSLENLQKYEKVTKTEAIQTTDFESAEAAKAAGYIQTGTTTITVDRQPDANGKYYTDDGKEIVVAPEIGNTNYFQNGLRNGALILEKATVTDIKDSLGNVKGQNVTWASQSWAGSEVIQDIHDSSDDAKAEADYETKSKIISTQDRILDTEIKQLETQHKAIETEEESVKQIIKSNIEKTFAVFKA